MERSPQEALVNLPVRQAGPSTFQPVNPQDVIIIPYVVICHCFPNI